MFILNLIQKALIGLKIVGFDLPKKILTLSGEGALVVITAPWKFGLKPIISLFKGPGIIANIQQIPEGLGMTILTFILNPKGLAIISILGLIGFVVVTKGAISAIKFPFRAKIEVPSKFQQWVETLPPFIGPTTGWSLANVSIALYASYLVYKFVQSGGLKNVLLILADNLPPGETFQENGGEQEGYEEEYYDVELENSPVTVSSAILEEQKKESQIKALKTILPKKALLKTILPKKALKVILLEKALKIIPLEKVE